MMRRKVLPYSAHWRTLRITVEAHRALYAAQAVHESFSDTILRLVAERTRKKR